MRTGRLVGASRVFAVQYSVGCAAFAFLLVSVKHNIMTRLAYAFASLPTHHYSTIAFLFGVQSVQPDIQATLRASGPKDAKGKYMKVSFLFPHVPPQKLCGGICARMREKCERGGLRCCGSARPPTRTSGRTQPHPGALLHTFARLHTPRPSMDRTR